MSLLLVTGLNGGKSGGIRRDTGPPRGSKGGKARQGEGGLKLGGVMDGRRGLFTSDPKAS